MTSSASTASRSKPVQYRRSADESLTTAVVTALATARGTEPLELDLRLSEYVDPDALEGFDCHPGNGRWSIEFTVEEHFVTVGSDGLVTVA